MADFVLSERIADHVHLITLNRPEQLNAMTAELCTALHGELDLLAKDRSCRAIILTGAGRGFCAGLDLRGYGQAPGNTGPLPASDSRLRWAPTSVSLQPRQQRCRRRPDVDSHCRPGARRTPPRPPRSTGVHALPPLARRPVRKFPRASVRLGRLRVAVVRRHLASVSTRSSASSSEMATRSLTGASGLRSGRRL